MRAMLAVVAAAPRKAPAVILTVAGVRLALGWKREARRLLVDVRATQRLHLRTN